MKLYTHATPSHERMLREFLIPSAIEFELRIGQSEQSGSGICGRKDFGASERGKVESMYRASLEPEGSIVLWCDADVQFFRPCVSRLIELLGDNDLAAQQANHELCAGFYVFRCNRRTRNLFDIILHDDISKYTNADQESLNIHKHLVRHRMLPIEEFWTVGPCKKVEIPYGIRIHHANWCRLDNKIRLLKRVRNIVRSQRSS